MLIRIVSSYTWYANAIRLEARAVQHAEISLSLLLFCLVWGRVKHNVFLSTYSRLINTLKIKFLITRTLRRFNQVSLVMVIHLSTSYALHWLIDAVHG